MKRLFAIVLAVSILETVRAGACTDSKDCENGQCCVTWGYLPASYCKDRVSEGESCVFDFLFTSQDSDEARLFQCPCEDGLSCQPQVQLELPFLGNIGFNPCCTGGNRDADINSTSTK